MKPITAILVLVLTLAAISLTVMPSHASISSIHGTVYWYDMYGNLHPLPWVQVIAEGEGGTNVVSSTTDGTYMMWVPAGSYNLTVAPTPGFYTPASKMVTVSDGGAVTADFELQPSGKPVPEYPSVIQPVMLLIATLVAAVLIRRHPSS